MKKLHAFEAMPFGKKMGSDETVIGFNAVYKNKWLKPFDEPPFIQTSGLLCGQSRRERYFKFKPQAQLKATSIESGEPPNDVYPYEHCYLRLLYIALAYCIGKVQILCGMAKVAMRQEERHISIIRLRIGSGRFVGYW